MSNVGGLKGNVGGDGSEINAYAYVDATGGTPTIQKAKNVSSITDSGVGEFIVVFATSLPSVNYSWSGQCDKDNGGGSPAVVYGLGTVARSAANLPVRTSFVTTPTDDAFSVIVTGA